jgi:uncharacterized protein involved in response to NO
MLFGYGVAVISGFLLAGVGSWINQPMPKGKPLVALAVLWLTGRKLPFFPQYIPDWLIAFLENTFTLGASSWLCLDYFGICFDRSCKIQPDSSFSGNACFHRRWNRSCNSGHDGTCITRSFRTTANSATDDCFSFCFALLNVSALLRVVAPVFTISNYRSQVLLSRSHWILTFLFFLWDYFPMLISPRFDGRPG